MTAYCPTLTRTLYATLSIATLLLSPGPAAADHHEESKSPKPPEVGHKAPDFQLQTVEGQKVRLSDAAEDGPVIVVVLRGYPGYQCPICNRQFAGFLANSEKIRQAGAQALFVYPGSAEKLKEHAREFLDNHELPGHYKFLVDPDYTFVKQYGLRWDEPNETAYPSAFVIDRHMKVHFAKVSKTHGNRASAEEVLEALDNLEQDAK